MFYAWDIKPDSEQAIPPILSVCMRRPVVSTCIRGIVEGPCGTMTADLVENYLGYIQDWYSQALQSAGLNFNICDGETIPKMVLSRLPIPSGRTKLGFSRLVEITAPGTALYTVWGKTLLASVQNMSKADFCTTGNVWVAYLACIMSADDRSEKSKFNILQFPQQMAPIYPGLTRCSRLKEFTACWNLLQKTCGARVHALAQHATLTVECCEIQSQMDTDGCHWQDMLLPHYLKASRVTVWPLASQCLNNPMHLESCFPGLSFNGIMRELDTVISLLHPGVEEISRKCGSRPAKHLGALLNKIHYLQRDAYNYTGWFCVKP